LRDIQLKFTGFEFCENSLLSDIPFQKRWILEGVNNFPVFKNQKEDPLPAETSLEDGEHNFPFKFVVPKNIPPTVYWRAGRLQIEYTLTAIATFSAVLPPFKATEEVSIGVPYIVDTTWSKGLPITIPGDKVSLSQSFPANPTFASKTQTLNRRDFDKFRKFSSSSSSSFFDEEKYHNSEKIEGGDRIQSKKSEDSEKSSSSSDSDSSDDEKSGKKNENEKESEKLDKVKEPRPLSLSSNNNNNNSSNEREIFPFSLNCKRKGGISVESWLSKAVVLPNDTIMVQCKIFNRSSAEITHFKVKLKRIIRYGIGNSDKMTVFKLKHKSPKFPLRKGDFFQEVLAMIPAESSLKPTVMSAALMKVRYYFSLKIAIRGRISMRLRMPVIVSTIVPIYKIPIHLNQHITDKTQITAPSKSEKKEKSKKNKKEKKNKKDEKAEKR
jgi:hypothetical protein